ncbi:hypothetical protein CV664_05425 [Borreliella burgdorferi]|nr:hypothetical protein CV664_05425 [Borreliella burgdorferi]
MKCYFFHTNFLLIVLYHILIILYHILIILYHILIILYHILIILYHILITLISTYEAPFTKFFNELDLMWP